MASTWRDRAHLAALVVLVDPAQVDDGLATAPSLLQHLLRGDLPALELLLANALLAADGGRYRLAAPHEPWRQDKTCNTDSPQHATRYRPHATFGFRPRRCGRLRTRTHAPATKPLGSDDHLAPSGDPLLERDGGEVRLAVASRLLDLDLERLDSAECWGFYIARSTHQQGHVFGGGLDPSPAREREQLGEGGGSA